MELAIKAFVEAIKSTEEYQTYIRERDSLRKNPQLCQEVDTYCRLHFELQRDEDTREEQLEAFERQYAEFRERPEVDAYLTAELDFCRMMQEVNMQVTKALDFDR